MNEEIGKAIDSLASGDNVSFINTMKSVLDSKLAEDETFIALGEDIDKFSKDENEEIYESLLLTENDLVYFKIKDIVKVSDVLNDFQFYEDEHWEVFGNPRVTKKIIVDKKYSKEIYDILKSENLVA